jgi:hypothetical protein
MMKKSKKVRWNPMIARLAEANMKETKGVEAPQRNWGSRSRWNPIIAGLANNEVIQSNGASSNRNNGTLKIKENWTNSAHKKRTQEEFQAYIHNLFTTEGPKVKYQNPDSWVTYPKEKKPAEY